MLERLLRLLQLLLLRQLLLQLLQLLLQLLAILPPLLLLLALLLRHLLDLALPGRQLRLQPAELHLPVARTSASELPRPGESHGSCMGSAAG